MERDAKLYMLSGKDWEVLKGIIEQNPDYRLKDDITIFQLYSASSVSLEYAILSLSEEMDEIIENYGATIAKEPNILRAVLHKKPRKPLYGDAANIAFLKNIP